MKVKITIPESLKDITLEKYQKYMKLIERKDEMDDYTFLKMVISLFTGLTLEQIDSIKQTELESLSNDITKALNQEVEFKKRFTMGGVEFGLIPSFDKMQSKEFYDLSGYSNDVDSLHKIMAVLFRPIKNSDSLENYTIEEYKGTEEWNELMKETPLNIVNGALGFFLTLQKDLQQAIQKSTDEVLTREKVQATTS